MRASAPDFTVEVRDRDFERLGQVAPEYTDLKFTDVFNGVGAWEMKLPAEHRLLPVLKTKGSGIIITEHWTEASKQAPLYGTWNEVDRNLYPDPLGTDTTALASSSGGTGSLVTDFPDSEVPTAYRWERTTTSAARMIDLKLGTAIPASPGWWLSFDIEASEALTFEVALRPSVGTTSVSTVVTNRSVPAGKSRQSILIDKPLGGDPTASAGITLICRTTGEFPVNAVIRITKVKMGATAAWFNPNAADTDVRRQGFVGGPNASQSTQEERTRTPQPDTIAHKYRVYSGRMRSARLSQDAADPKGTWLITGVHDNVIAAATSVLPDPAHDADAQAASHWSTAGDGETVMKQAVSLNAGSGAIVRRRYPWLTIAPNLLRGAQVKTSSRFDGLGDLLTSLGTAAGLGWRFAQQGDVVEFDVYEPADKTKVVRLDIRNGGVESNELGYTAPSATDVFVMGQGQGEDRTVMRVTTPEAQAEAEEWGIRWETTKDQRQTDDADELEQAGLEVVTEQGVTVNSLKIVPSDHPRMRLGVDWYIGDRITAVVEAQETTALVTQVATSISSAGVIRQATIGDPVGFNFDAKIASKVKDVEKRVGAVERLVGQGVNWPDIANKVRAVTNWNTAIEVGYYESAPGATNAPFTGYEFAGHVTYVGGKIVQTLSIPFQDGRARTQWVRSWNGTTFSPWTRSDRLMKATGGSTSTWTYDPVSGRYNLVAGSKKWDFDGIFTAEFRAYVIRFNWYSSTSDGAGFAFRQAGVDNRSNNYQVQAVYANGGGGMSTAQQTTTQGAWPAFSATGHWGEITVTEPMYTAGTQNQKRTRWEWGTFGPATITQGIAGLSNYDTAPLDGFTLYKSNQGLDGIGAGSHSWISVEGVA
ncbi:minor tail protein [Microbacterium phage Celaena]|uniref:minor tail protein n=1 Tax=Microbacterium phage Celaena TaxID=2591214 RepID=UPI001162BCCE|nr:minor tail protein [Microbacterium phage Celaena]QDH92396.1 minor tail protein [Microbacterium phage Celaena]